MGGACYERWAGGGGGARLRDKKSGDGGGEVSRPPSAAGSRQVRRSRVRAREGLCTCLGYGAFAGLVSLLVNLLCGFFFMLTCSMCVFTKRMFLILKDLSFLFWGGGQGV